MAEFREKLRKWAGYTDVTPEPFFSGCIGRQVFNNRPFIIVYHGPDLTMLPLKTKSAYTYGLFLNS